MLAASASPEPAIRHLTYDNVKKLYEHRGGAAHAARVPPPEVWLASQIVARQAFIDCIERGSLPEPVELLKDWSRTANEPYRPL